MLGQWLKLVLQVEVKNGLVAEKLASRHLISHVQVPNAYVYVNPLGYIIKLCDFGTAVQLTPQMFQKPSIWCTDVYSTPKWVVKNGKG